MKRDEEIAAELVLLLREKRQLFEQFELIAEEMMTDSADEIDRILDCVEEREQLMQTVDELDQKIKETAMQSVDGSTMLKASKNLCDFSELNESYQDIFRAGQEIFGIISRIQTIDPQINKNMESMMEELREKIKQNKQNSKFTGYMNNMGIQRSTGVLYDKKR